MHTNNATFLYLLEIRENDISKLGITGTLSLYLYVKRFASIGPICTIWKKWKTALEECYLW